MLTYSQRKSFAQHGASVIDATIKAALVSLEAQQVADQAARIAAYNARHAPVAFTEAELKAARFVRTVLGWHRVVRVSAKSVTVETGYSWTDRHDHSKILEVRTIGETA